MSSNSSNNGVEGRYVKNIIATIGNFKSAWLVKKVISGFKSGTQFPIQSMTLDFVKATNFSDRWFFWHEGYPAVMLTDTAFYRNPHYHQDSDTYETLDYSRMAEVVKGLYSAIFALANSK
jgi:hypothetical protein